jgi:signal transduction histidine kinase
MPHPPHWRTHHPDWLPHRSANWVPHMRRFVLWRFVLFFGVMALFFLGALIVIAGIAFGPLQDTLPRTLTLALLLCGVPVVFIMLVGMLGGWTFRRFGRPIADVMAAADAVSEGDLSVRLRESYPGEIGRLARSFNRMTSELQHAEQQRRNLTSDVAHELRTPLHIIQGNLEGILDGVYQPETGVIKATLEETHQLARLVSDLQTISLAEDGQLPLHKIHVSASDLLEDASARFRSQADEAGVALEVSFSGDSDALEIEVDPDRVGQVLNNLITNALHQTPPGGWIRLSAVPIEGGVQLSVRDSGAGISPADQPFIFDRFWKGDRSRSRQGGSGSGLGLAIARQLVKAHDGKIDVSSEPGEGTLFTIELHK